MLATELDKLGRTRLSINSPELFTTLIALGYMEPFSYITAINLPPNFTLEWTVNVPEGFVSILTEEVIVISPDHAISMEIEMDGKRIFYDPDMVQTRYSTPLNFFRVGAFYPAKSYLKFKVSNKSASMAYWSGWSMGGRIIKKWFDAIITKYFETIKGEVTK